MTPQPDPTSIRFAIPKGRMHEGVTRLLDDAGIAVRMTSRDYRPALSLDGFEVKILKPQAIIEMLDLGARDLGFAGADWVEERGTDLVELLDTKLDTVRLVAAAPEAILDDDGKLPDRKLVVASEYTKTAQRWIERKRLDATILHSYGATEVLPPEDADCIIDNTATGATLRANGLRIIDEIATSSTRLYAARAAMDDPTKRERIERFAMLIASVLEARTRVMLEVNVPAEALERVVNALPSMNSPTVAPMHNGGHGGGTDTGYAVKSAVPRDQLTDVIPAVKAAGGRDIIVTTPEQIVP